MTRHIADRNRTGNDGERLRAYVEIERAEKPSAATRKAQRQGETGDDGRRVEEFVRIEKGREA